MNVNEYYWNNREKRLKYSHDRYPSIREEMRAYNKKYYKEHSEFIRFKRWMNRKKVNAEKRAEKLAERAEERLPFTTIEEAFRDDVYAPAMCSALYHATPANKFFPITQVDKISITFD